MKKKLITILCTLCTAALLGGCGNEGTVLSELKTDKYVTLGEYKGMEVSFPAKETIVSDYQNNYINYELSNHAEWVTITEERGAELGDTVNIDYEGKKDGVAFEGGTAQGFDLELGSGSFIDGFEDGLVGVKAGETKDLELTFPEEYHAQELAGAEVVFTVTVNEIKVSQQPELTDEFVKALDNDCSTVAEYEAYVRQVAEEVYEDNLEQELIDVLLESSTFQEPPEAMVDQYYDKAVSRMSQLAVSNGMTLETLITTYYGTTMEDFQSEARAGAVLSCKEAIMLQAVANAEGITVSQDEVDAALQEAADNNGYESTEALLADMGEEHYEDYVMCDKVLTLIRENAIITEQ